MDETEKIVAAIYAATVTWNEPKNLSDFLGHYEACIAALGVRRAAAKEAEVDRSIETMKKAGR
jgi:hypothetical protein